MVPYHNPIPEKRQQSGVPGTSPQRRGSNDGGPSFIGAWVQAEKMMQIALTLPSAGFIGWLIGYGLDRWLHQTWMGTTGAIFGIIAGLVGVVRMAMGFGPGSKPRSAPKSGNEPDGRGGSR
jgi:hypothetical protein